MNSLQLFNNLVRNSSNFSLVLSFILNGAAVWRWICYYAFTKVSAKYPDVADQWKHNQDVMLVMSVAYTLNAVLFFVKSLVMKVAISKKKYRFILAWSVIHIFSPVILIYLFVWFGYREEILPVEEYITGLILSSTLIIVTLIILYNYWEVNPRLDAQNLLAWTSEQPDRTPVIFTNEANTPPSPYIMISNGNKQMLQNV